MPGRAENQRKAAPACEDCVPTGQQGTYRCKLGWYGGKPHRGVCESCVSSGFAEPIAHDAKADERPRGNCHGCRGL